MLGAMLVAEGAINMAVVDVHLRPEHFYRESHRAIYRSILALNAKNEGIDALTVCAELAERGQLDDAGGKPYVHQLAAAIPSAGNARHYAQLVKEQATLRALLEASQQIQARVGERTGEPHQLVEDAERMLFEIAHSERSGDFRSIEEILHEEIDKLEALSRDGQAMTGTPSGFRELDDITGGFQPSNLIVLAARPSMGKSALVANIAETVAVKYDKPVALFSLEMSETELAQRFVASQARMSGDKLRKGQVARNDWPKVVKACQALERAPLWVDDSSDIDILELRAKARRLHSSEKSRGGLGLIVVDYLQLMRPDYSADSRVVQIGQISRGLKILARELNVPVLTVSQLSRAPEQRPDKRPLLSDLRECVAGETLVMLADGSRVPIDSLVGTRPQVLAVDDDGQVVKAASDKVWRVGKREVLRVRLASGRSIRATADHRLRTGKGWQTLRELGVGDRVALAKQLPEPDQPLVWSDDKVALLGHLVGDGSYLPNRPLRYTTASEDNSEVVASAAKREFGAWVSRHEGPGGSWHQLVIAGNGNRWHHEGLGAWLRELGIWGQRSHEKRLPAAAFHLPNGQVALLLRHLWATDGSIWCGQLRTGRKARRVYYASTSEGLAKDVASLLLRLGIVARITSSKSREYRPAYHVDVSGADFQLRFLDLVGTHGPRTGQGHALKAMLQTIDAPNTNVDTLPIEVWNDVRQAMAARGVSQRAMAAARGTSYGGASHFKFAPSRATIESYAVTLDEPALLSATREGLFWDRVIEIEADGNEDVFDLTVPGPACWLADGIVTHNSGNIEQDSDLVMFIYRDEYYNPETTDNPGVAEILISKHRNGPVGRLELTFLERFPKFANKAREQTRPIEQLAGEGPPLVEPA